MEKVSQNMHGLVVLGGHEIWAVGKPERGRLQATEEAEAKVD